MTVCKKCGHKTEKKGLFCPRCGNAYSESVGVSRAKNTSRLRGFALTLMGVSVIILLTSGLILYNTMTYKEPGNEEFTASEATSDDVGEVTSDKLPSLVEGVSLHFYEQAQALIGYVREGGLEDDITVAYHDTHDFKQISNDLRNQLDQLDLIAKSGGESTYARVVRKVSNAYRDHLITKVTKEGTDPAAVNSSQITMDALWQQFDNALTREQVSAML